MGRRRGKSYTLPSSPSHSFSSSSSSDFEFTISISPRKSSTTFCHADELFYKGQLLPLHLSPRISMVRTLLLSSPSSSSTTTTTTTTTARDSTDSHSSFNSDLALLPDLDDDYFKRSDLHNPATAKPKSTNKYFSFSTFSSVKRISTTAKEVIRKYFNKVKPLYDKFSHKHKSVEFNIHMEHPTTTTTTTSVLSLLTRRERSKKDTQVSVVKRGTKVNNSGILSHSFSGNLRYPRTRRSCVSSCPSSIRSSPTHSGVLSFPPPPSGRDASSMEDLHSAIQGAIAHCKNSLIQNQTSNINSHPH